jgi:type II secretory pathway component PulJ
MTLLELLVVIGLMAALAGSLSTLVGVAVRSKLIVAVRSADTETARQTLEWMSERLRNAGLNLKPGDQPELRCKDMVVAQEAALRPTASAFYASGEILNSDTVAGNEVITIGYLLGPDPVTGNPVVLEYQQLCTAGAGATTTPLSDPRIAVTNFQFDYFSSSGLRITDLTSASEIRRIRLVRITLNVQGSQGQSGLQTQTWTRDVMLRNPEPNANDWKNPNENI